MYFCLLDNWENDFIVIGWEQANLSLTVVKIDSHAFVIFPVKRPVIRLKAPAILREFSNITCSVNP